MLPASRDDGICVCEGCEKPKAKKHPMCHGHAKRYQKNGVIGGLLRKRGESGIPRFGPNGGDCAIEGCEQRAKSRGLCIGHHQAVFRSGAIVQDGMIVPRQVNSDGWAIGDPWIKWSSQACGRMSEVIRRKGRDKWTKWAVLKFGHMRQQESRYRSWSPKPHRGACNATWDTKVESMRKGLSNTAAKHRCDKWRRWSTTKAILIYGRQSRNCKAA